MALLLSGVSHAQCCCGEMLLTVEMDFPQYTHDIIAVSLFDELGRNREELLSDPKLGDRFVEIKVDTGCGLPQLKVVVQRGSQLMQIHFFAIPSDRNFEYMPIGFQEGYYPVFVPQALELDRLLELEDRHKFILQPLIRRDTPMTCLGIARIVNYSPIHKPNFILEITEPNIFKRRIGSHTNYEVAIQTWNPESGKWLTQSECVLQDDLRIPIVPPGKGLHRIVSPEGDELHLLSYFTGH